uniref:Putative flavin-containing amine oxidase n=2 Tax=Ornithodoros turicata TaxID=34597 RepID=A0A2R5LA80_9ACAR
MFPRKELAPSNSSNPRVVIVGAGAAGLSAAYKLMLKGHTNFVILEAQNNAGGRIQSYYYEDKVLELGAQWVHGEEGNLLYGFAMSNGLLADPRRQSSPEGRGHFCTDQGTRLPKEAVDEVVAVLDEIKEELCGKRTRHTHTKTAEPLALHELPTSVGEYMRSRFHEYLLQHGEREDMTKVKWAIYDWYWRFEVIDNSCYSLDELSCKSYEEFEDCPGIRNINFKNGFSSIVKTLLSEIPESNVRYGKPVKRVHWDAVQTHVRQTKTPRSSISNSQETIRENVPYVECEDGEIILCRHVLLTVSAGYLKHHVDDLFQPRLPEKKRQALRGIGFGTINKIYLIFVEPFWNPGDEGFQLIWLDDKLNEEDWWLRGISGFDPVYGNPNALVAWIGGRASEYMETLSNETVSDACTRALRMFLSRDIPQPKAVVRSFWNSNPYILGSYSNRQLPYEASETLLETFYEPLLLDVPLHRAARVEWPLVLFAGEATDKDFYSTVHGAMRSGFREADRLINFWRKRDEIIRESSAQAAQRPT